MTVSPYHAPTPPGKASDGVGEALKRPQTLCYAAVPFDFAYDPEAFGS
jgi:hypothetical protein